MKNADNLDDPKYPYRDIGERLHAIRITTGMSKKEFAEFYGFNYTRYINWESGHRRMLPDEAIVLCEGLNVTLDFIYRGKEAQLPQNVVMALRSIPFVNATSSSNVKLE